MKFDQAWKPLRRLTWKPLAFPKDGTNRLHAGEKIEEETIPGYVKDRYCSVRIGQILRERYRIVGKLGFGTSSNVWLARDFE